MDLAANDLLFNGIQESGSVDSQDILDKKTSDENSQIVLGDGFEDRCSYKAVREAYCPRDISKHESNYKSYLCSVVAYWASNLAVDPTVKDFKISINNERWGAFGDAVVEIERIILGKPSVTTTFAVQFKYLASSDYTNVDSFSNGNFSFANVISKLATVIAGEDSTNAKFIMYSTATVSPDLNLDQPLLVAFCMTCLKLKDGCICPSTSELKEVPIIAKLLSTRSKNIIDTSDSTQSVYCFSSPDNKFELPIYLNTSQKKPQHFLESIDELFLNVLEERNVQVARELIKYIENWSNGERGVLYKLNQEDVLLKLGQLFLSRFVVTPKVKSMDPHNTFDLWLQAVDRAEVTVLKDSVNLSEICEPMNLLIEKELGLKIDVANKSVQFLRTSERNDTDKIANPILRNYILEELPGNFDNSANAIPMEKVYMIFWKAGLVPLILKVNSLKDQQYVLQVINLLKGLWLNRRYFVKTSDPNIKTLVKSFKNVSFFLTLDDVAEKLDPRVWDQVKIDITERFSLNLNVIRETDKFFQKSVSATEFFDMVLGRYVFKPVGSRFTQDSCGDLKLIMNDTQIKILRQEVESKIDSRPVSGTEFVPKHMKWPRGLDPYWF